MILKQTGEIAPANEPWRLIRDAIHDLELQENTPQVVVNMNHWHRNVPSNKRCIQCLAGAVMSRRLGVDVRVSVDPSKFPGCYDRLIALDHFRNGFVRSAYQRLDLADHWGDPPPGVSSNVDITPYHDNPAQFKKDLLRLADTLERAHTQGQKNDS